MCVKLGVGTMTVRNEDDEDAGTRPASAVSFTIPSSRSAPSDFSASNNLSVTVMVAVSVGEKGRIVGSGMEEQVNDI